MRRADGCRWVHGVGCACLPWWIPRLVRGCTVICAPSAPGCGRGLLTRHGYREDANTLTARIQTVRPRDLYLYSETAQHRSG